MDATMKARVLCRITRGNELHVQNDIVSVGPHSFQVGSALGADAQQHDVYMSIGQALVDWLLSGYNATVLSWGDEGSGKTTTMFGTAANPGLVPRCAQGMFEHISRSANASSWQVGVSFFNIQGQTRVDVLDHSLPALATGASPLVTTINDAAQFQDILRTARDRSHQSAVSSDKPVHCFCKFTVYNKAERCGSTLTFCDLQGSSIRDPERAQTQPKQSSSSKLDMLSIERMLHAISSQGAESRDALGLLDESALCRAIHPLLTKNARLFLIGTVSGEAKDELASKRVLQLLSASTNITARCTRVSAFSWDHLCGASSASKSVSASMSRQESSRSSNSFASADTGRSSVRFSLANPGRESSAMTYGEFDVLAPRSKPTTETASNAATVSRTTYQSTAIPSAIFTIPEESVRSSRSSSAQFSSKLDAWANPQADSVSSRPAHITTTTTTTSTSNGLVAPSADITDFLQQTDRLLYPSQREHISSLSSTAAVSSSKRHSSSVAAPLATDIRMHAATSLAAERIRKLQEELAVQHDEAKFWQKKAVERAAAVGSTRSFSSKPMPVRPASPASTASVISADETLDGDDTSTVGSPAKRTNLGSFTKSSFAVSRPGIRREPASPADSSVDMTPRPQRSMSPTRTMATLFESNAMDRVKQRIVELQEQNKALIVDRSELQDEMLQYQEERDSLKVRCLRLEDNLTLAEEARNSAHALSQRLFHELDDMQAAYSKAEQKQVECETKYESASVEQTSLSRQLKEAKHDVKALRAENASLSQQIELLNTKIAVLKEGKANMSRQEHKLLEIITELHNCVSAAAAHAKNCTTRGYFATRSTKLHESVKQVFDNLVSLATETDPKGKKKAALAQLQQDAAASSTSRSARSSVVSKQGAK